MSPIKWRVTYEGSPHKQRSFYKGCATPENISPCPLLESAVSCSVADDAVSAPLPITFLARPC